ncbi:alcohol dehydrogenase catalytic domain-containing protein, partial [Acinetobacter baumannii]|uniref:alcohol dehydrogenase catalytic domain-containing protein n=1 Tax=Acinetobacter baumannii TaxID=470 RepID=UPI0030C1654F
MRALTYHGAEDVRVETVADPIIQEPDDIILRVTATAICGSDLHLYRGKIPKTEHGDIFGHEFMGIVEEVGPAVTAVKKGDRVIVPFVIACGDCFFCQLDLTAACETTNTGRGAIINKKQIPPGAALFGYSHLYGGVPNKGPFKVPGSLSDEKVLFLTDILPTAWQAVTNAQVKRGSTVAIYGAGPVGLLSAACAKMLGAEKIFMVDHNEY